MADFRDLSESAAARWMDILANSDVTFEAKNFPFEYYKETAKQFGLSEDYLDTLAQYDPRKANVLLIYYAIYPIMRTQVSKFFSDPDLNMEFSNLISSAKAHQIKLEV